MNERIENAIITLKYFTKYYILKDKLSFEIYVPFIGLFPWYIDISSLSLGKSALVTG